jgi:hypothetical protein
MDQPASKLSVFVVFLMALYGIVLYHTSPHMGQIDSSNIKPITPIRYRESDLNKAAFNKAFDATVIVQANDSCGTGVIASYKGSVYIITCYHILYSDTNPTNMVNVVISQPNNKVAKFGIPASVKSMDEINDIVIFEIKNKKIIEAFDPIELSDEEIVLGQGVFHIGNFLGGVLPLSISKGVVSNNRSLILTNFQCDLVAIEGSSGGGIFRCHDGKLLGIVRATYQNKIAFVIPTSKIINAINLP